MCIVYAVYGYILILSYATNHKKFNMCSLLYKITNVWMNVHFLYICQIRTSH